MIGVRWSDPDEEQSERYLLLYWRDKTGLPPRPATFEEMREAFTKFPRPYKVTRRYSLFELDPSRLAGLAGWSIFLGD